MIGQQLPGDAGIARRAPHPGHPRRLREFPNQRVFASAGTNDQDFHAARIQAGSERIGQFEFLLKPFFTTDGLGLTPIYLKFGRSLGMVSTYAEGL